MPTLRIITTSVESPSIEPELQRRAGEVITRFDANDLLFSFEETAHLAAGVAARHAHAAGMSETSVLQRIHEVTRGIPLGVSLAVDRLSTEGDWSGHQLSLVMNTVHADVLRAHMRSMHADGLSAMFRTLSLMPRFSYLHISACFPNAAPETIDQLAASPAIMARRRLRAGEYAWSEEFLFAARELNTARVADRRELATLFYRRNFAGGAFEQWFLAGDLARAEAMLRTRFLTVFETLSPETAQEVYAIVPTDLAAYPMIRVLQMLLNPRASVVELRHCVENLGILGARGGAAGLLALAVRAAVLARKGLAKLAHDQAEQVLNVAADLMLEDSEETEAERRTAAEASLTATLALFEIGAMPSRLAVLPRGHNSPFLQRRRDLAQQFLDLLRAEPAEQEAFPSRVITLGYRALVFSDSECFRGIDSLVAHDERFLEALRGMSLSPLECAPGESSYVAPLKYFSSINECLRLLTLDDQSGAIEVAYRNDVFQPQSNILQAIVLLATGREKEAKASLDSLGEGRGARTEAVRAVLSASALLKLGHVESARSTLARAEPLPPTVLVQALGFIRNDEGRKLAELYPPFENFVKAAAATGVLGTGRQIGGACRFQTLTEKERVVLLGLREGLNTREIAERHYLSVNTVRTHVRSIGKKLDARGQAEMLRRAEELRIFPDW